MQAGVIEIDVHGKNEYQAKIMIDSAIKRAKTGTYRIRIIHGYHNGTVLKDMIQQEYRGKVLRIITGNNPGITQLILREY